MTDSNQHQPAEPDAARGERAWKAAKEAVAKRNEQARKAARRHREAEDRRMAERRRRLR